MVLLFGTAHLKKLSEKSSCPASSNLCTLFSTDVHAATTCPCKVHTEVQAARASGHKAYTEVQAARASGHKAHTEAQAAPASGHKAYTEAQAAVACGLAPRQALPLDRAAAAREICFVW